ncbi:hypothetical protein SCOR_27430 [Sulfidibacter corallicola]
MVPLCSIRTLLVLFCTLTVGAFPLQSFAQSSGKQANELPCATCTGGNVLLGQSATLSVDAATGAFSVPIDLQEYVTYLPPSLSDPGRVILGKPTIDHVSARRGRRW